MWTLGFLQETEGLTTLLLSHAQDCCQRNTSWAATPGQEMMQCQEAHQKQRNAEAPDHNYFKEAILPHF